jgi:hypothetical protein
MHGSLKLTSYKFNSLVMFALKFLFLCKSLIITHVWFLGEVYKKSFATETKDGVF